MSDLIAFIEARLAEDESAALAASGTTPRLQKAGFSAHWHTEPWYDGTGERCVLRAGVAGDLTSPGGIDLPAGEHAARHDPARVLREVEAKRRLVSQHSPVVDGTQSTWAWFAGSESASEGVLKTLAAVWSEHPDYRAEWRPE